MLFEEKFQKYRINKQTDKRPKKVSKLYDFCKYSEHF